MAENKVITYPAFGRDDVDIRAEDTVFQGFFTMKTYQFRHKLFGAAEQPEQVARREAAEEAGLSLGRMIPLLSYMSSPGGTTERIHLYLGELNTPVQGGVFGLAEEQEDIKVHVLSRQQAIDLLNAGKIDNAATVIALQWLSLHLDSVRAQWALPS